MARLTTERGHEEEKEEEAQEEAAQILFLSRRSHLELGTLFSKAPSSLAACSCAWVSRSVRQWLHVHASVLGFHAKADFTTEVRVPGNLDITSSPFLAACRLVCESLEEYRKRIPLVMASGKCQCILRFLLDRDTRCCIQRCWFDSGYMHCVSPRFFFPNFTPFPHEGGLGCTCPLHRAVTCSVSASVEEHKELDFDVPFVSGSHLFGVCLT